MLEPIDVFISTELPVKPLPEKDVKASNFVLEIPSSTNPSETHDSVA